MKLELVSLNDQRPTEQHAVRPWVVDDLPVAFPDWQCQVPALELARTFWEKATILHAEHLPADARLAALARDSTQMRAMFIASPPGFEVVMARLAEAEQDW